MNTEALQNLRAYWEELRGDRIAPYRAELDPRKFEDVLENMFILEQLNPTQVRVRLAGMALCELMGMEVRGMPPEAFISADHRSMFSQNLNAVLSGPTVVELDLLAVDTEGEEVAAQMLLLPLRSDFGEVTRILGCVITEIAEIRAPVNFRILEQRNSDIDAPVTTTTADMELPGFAEAQTTFHADPKHPVLRTVAGNPSAPQGERKRGHLRLVRDA